MKRRYVKNQWDALAIAKEIWNTSMAADKSIVDEIAKGLKEAYARGYNVGYGRGISYHKRHPAPS